MWCSLKLPQLDSRMSYGAHLAGRAPVHDAAIAALERLLQSQEDDDSPSAECNSDPNLPCCDIFARLEEPCGEYLPGYFGGDDDTSGGDDEQGDDDDDDFLTKRIASGKKSTKKTKAMSLFADDDDDDEDGVWDF